MAYDKSFARFEFVASRTFFLPISLPSNEVAIFDHPSGAQSVPPGTTPERGCIRRISRSASAGVRHRNSPASPRPTHGGSQPCNGEMSKPRLKAWVRSVFMILSPAGASPQLNHGPAGFPPALEFAPSSHRVCSHPVPPRRLRKGVLILIYEQRVFDV